MNVHRPILDSSAKLWQNIHRAIMLEYIVTIGNIMYNTYWDEISEKIGANVTLCGDQAA